MSTAFDTKNRRQLLDIKSIVDEDGHRLIQFFLGSTIIDTWCFYIKAIHKQCSNPTGRQLKPASIHCVIRTYAQRSPTYIAETNNLFRSKDPTPSSLPGRCRFHWAKLQILRRSKKLLDKYQLKVNTDKTEYTSILKSEERWKEVKK